MVTEESSDDKSKVLNFLLNLGCCQRCTFRFLDDTAALHDLEISAPVTDHETVKKSKPNPCVICLGLLQDYSIQLLLLSSELNGIQEYDCDTFVNFISMPLSIFLREYSLELHLKESFPEWMKDRVAIPINKAWSSAIHGALAGKLNKTFNKNSDFQIQFNMACDTEETETTFLETVQRRQKSKTRDGLPSRKFLIEYLKTVSLDDFKKQFSVPPSIPVNSVSLESVTYKHEPIFIAGRYCKYSRTLGQTPWIVDGVRIMESSVQEIIFDAIGDTFMCKNLVFSSSGREDFDVRTLGKGRPFVIRICDSKNTKVSEDKFRSIENIVKSSKIVKIRYLQFIDKKTVNLLKEGEEHKRKSYKALCVIDEPDRLDEYIKKINETKKVSLQQNTPIRVIHRRSSDMRRKEIFKMKARCIPDRKNFFELDVVTQAGTYVKEFVHGDFGRTRPCLRDIISGHVDIVALDVTNIHLVFPPLIK